MNHVQVQPTKINTDNWTMATGLKTNHNAEAKNAAVEKYQELQR